MVQFGSKITAPTRIGGAMINNHVLLKAAQGTQKYQLISKNLAVFCNIHRPTLNDLMMTSELFRLTGVTTHVNQFLSVSLVVPITSFQLYSFLQCTQKWKQGSAHTGLGGGGGEGRECVVGLNHRSVSFYHHSSYVFWHHPQKSKTLKSLHKMHFDCSFFLELEKPLLSGQNFVRVRLICTQILKVK